jgi:hypothetical protein
MLGPFFVKLEHFSWLQHFFGFPIFRDRTPNDRVFFKEGEKQAHTFLYFTEFITNKHVV